MTAALALYVAVGLALAMVLEREAEYRFEAAHWAMAVATWPALLPWMIRRAWASGLALKGKRR